MKRQLILHNNRPLVRMPEQLRPHLPAAKLHRLRKALVRTVLQAKPVIMRQLREKLLTTRLSMMNLGLLALPVSRIPQLLVFRTLLPRSSSTPTSTVFHLTIPPSLSSQPAPPARRPQSISPGAQTTTVR